MITYALIYLAMVILTFFFMITFVKKRREKYKAYSNEALIGYAFLVALFFPVFWIGLIVALFVAGMSIWMDKP